MLRQTQSSKADTEKTPLGQRVSRVMRFVISIGLVVYILTQVDLRDVFAALALANWWLIVLALGLQLVGIALISLRFKLLLGVENIHPGFRYLFVSTLCSIFFRQFLPSTLGGDALRGYDAWKAGATRPFAVLALFVDRLLGLGALASFAVLSLSVFGAIEPGLGTARIWGLGGLIAVATAIVLLFVQPAFLTRPLGRIAAALPGKLAVIAGRIYQVSSSFVGHHDVLLRGAFISFLLQTNVVVFYWLLAKSLSLSVPFTSFFIIVPIAVFVMMAPISINGIGLREAIFVYILGMWGVENELALAVAWLEFGTVIAVGAIGGIVFSIRRTKVAHVARN